MGRRINLQSLIDEVLEMVKRKKSEKQDPGFDQRDWLSNEAYNKDIRARNTEIAKQELINKGLAERENISNAGAFARQGLANVGNENTANIQAGASRYGADLGLRGHEATANATVRAAEINAGKTTDDDKGFSTLMGKVIENDPSILSDSKRLNETASNIRSFFPPSAKVKDSYYTPEISRPVAPVVTPAPVTKPVPSAPSMEFASDDVIRKRKLAQRGKTVEEQMFGPKKDRGIFSAF